MVSTTDPESAAHDDGSLAVVSEGNSDTPIDGGTQVQHNDPVAIIDDGTGLHVGRLTTDGVLNV